MTLNHIDQKDSLIHTNFFEIKFSKILLTIRKREEIINYDEIN